MRYSKLFGKTDKNAKDYKSINATLLQKGGFINQSMAGVYTFLPLGLRVLTKIEEIIREEMDEIGQEMLMPALSPKEIWEKTGRIATVDVLMKTKAANKYSEEKNRHEYVLNSTHEEVVTPIAKKYNFSHKDLPVAVYQIQSKFRNEPRAKSGILRCREFRMKDLYSFHKSEEGLKKYYEESKEAYWKVFERLGLKESTFIALASGGDFTDDYSHEFQTVCESGEDLIFYSKKQDIAYNREVAPSKAPEFKQDDNEMLPREDVKGEGIIGVQELTEFLKIDIERTTKTMIYKTNEGKVIAAAVRGDYEINEEKLIKAIGCESLVLASQEVVQEATGADIGYAGILDLSDHVKLIIDESVGGRTNFECGANKLNYHSINVNFGRDLPEPEKFYDIKLAKEGDFYPETGELFETYVVSEVGNIFPLYTKFSEAFDYNFTDENGEQQIVYMGSYGIGPSRLMGVLVEKFNDENGIIWPEQVAPYQIHLVGLNLEDTKVKKKAEKLYSDLIKKGIEVLYDDREEVRPGEKFADSDLIGIPLRVVISKRTEDKVEVKRREKDSETKIMSIDDLLEIL